jgi:hypothetical protein
MNRIIYLAVITILLPILGECQTFLEAYNVTSKRQIKKFIKSHITELDTIFKAYKAKTNFDFNNSDTLFIIYDAPASSLFTSDIIIRAGRDTISYTQEFETIKPFKQKRIIRYQPFVSRADNLNGFKRITERDSIITLVSKRDYNTINHLGNNQIINDGSIVSIYVALKTNGKYKIETCFPKQFVIPDVHRKE